MKPSSSFMLAAGVAALFAAPVLQAAEEPDTTSVQQETPRQLGGPDMQSGGAAATESDAGRNASGARTEEEGSLSGSTGNRGAADPWTQSNELERGGSMSGATGATGSVEKPAGTDEKATGAAEDAAESSKPATDWPYGSTQSGTPAGESLNNAPDDSSPQR